MEVGNNIFAGKLPPFGGSRLVIILVLAFKTPIYSRALGWFRFLLTPRTIKYRLGKILANLKNVRLF